MCNLENATWIEAWWVYFQQKRQSVITADKHMTAEKNKNKDQTIITERQQWAEL